MEIADIFAINQADRPGADESVKDLQMMIRETRKIHWTPPILKTVATREENVEELIEQIDRHKAYLQDSGVWKEKRQNRNITRFNTMVLNLLPKKYMTTLEQKQKYRKKYKKLEMV